MSSALPSASTLSPTEQRRRELQRRARELAHECEAFHRSLSGGVPQSERERKRWAELSTSRQVLEVELEVLALTADYVDAEQRSAELRCVAVPDSIEQLGAAERWLQGARRDRAVLQHRMTSLAELLSRRRGELEDLKTRQATSSVQEVGHE